jgi:hypothetical protein
MGSNYLRHGQMKRRLLASLAVIGMAITLSGCVIAPYHGGWWHGGYYRH